MNWRIVDYQMGPLIGAMLIAAPALALGAMDPSAPPPKHAVKQPAETEAPPLAPAVGRKDDPVGRPKAGSATVASPKPAKGTAGLHALVDFQNSPYPLDKNIEVPGTDKRFFDQDANGRRFHVSPRGGKLFEQGTYDNRRTLLFVPDLRKGAPEALVLFLHGNLATLSRDVVGRQQVLEQVQASGLAAVLVAPQLAVDALDSSPGRFYEPGFLDTYLGEAAIRLSALSGGKLSAQTIDTLPLILVAYSGGYLATAFSFPNQSGTKRPIAGVILLDALFGEEEKVARWIEQAHERAFFVSAYSPASAGLNARLAGDLRAASIKVEPQLPSALRSGDIVLQAVAKAVHNDFVTTAWVKSPLSDVLARVKHGFAKPKTTVLEGAGPVSPCPVDAPDCATK